MIKARFTLCCVFASCCVHALWPQPQQYQHGSSVVWLSPEVQMVFEPLQPYWRPLQWLLGTGSPSINSVKTIGASKNAQIPAQTLLEEAFERVKQDILERSIIPSKFYPSGAKFEPLDHQPFHRVLEVITVQHVKRLRHLAGDYYRGSEAYLLSIDDNGRATIQMTSPQGGLAALQTLAQIFFAHSDASLGAYCPDAPLTIADFPRFEHRGLNLDISRNWISPADVLRTIEAMASSKLNQLHLHAADAQSWPLEVPTLPELAKKGAYGSSQMWSVEDLENVQRHGFIHGVEIFIEIDLPGHTTAIGQAYPELLTAANKQPWSQFALQPPAGQLRLNSSKVEYFLKSLLDDLLPRTSAWSSKMHVGGDELNLEAYAIDPTVRSSSRKVLQPLLQAFINHIISIAQPHGVRLIVWEEMALEWNLTLPDSLIVQTWRSTSALEAVLAKGHKAIFGPKSHWYLDCGHGSFLDPSLKNPNLADPERIVKPPYTDYCNPYKNWRHVYSYNPLDGVSEDHRHLIFGGEVSLWGELTDSVTLDGMLWPRAAAAAEVMWSGTTKMPDEDITRRLAEFRERLVARGIAAGMVQTEWCLRNKGGCTL